MLPSVNCDQIPSTTRAARVRAARRAMRVVSGDCDGRRVRSVEHGLNSRGSVNTYGSLNFRTHSGHKHSARAPAGSNDAVVVEIVSWLCRLHSTNGARPSRGTMRMCGFMVRSLHAGRTLDVCSDAGRVAGSWSIDARRHSRERRVRVSATPVAGSARPEETSTDSPARLRHDTAGSHS